MTIQECYQAMGGDFEQLEKRFPSKAMVRRFIARFLEDGTYAQLCQAMETGNREEAFRSAHTLKGVSANLGLDGLLASVSALTDVLRVEANAIPAGADALLERVTEAYAQTVRAIHEYLDSAE